MKKKKALKNYFTGIAYTLITALIGVIATPILLRHLGSIRMGAYRAMMDWLGYFSLLEMGLSGSLRALLAESIGAKDRKATVNSIFLGLRAYFYSGVAMILSGIGLTLVIGKLIPVPIHDLPDLKTAAIIAVVQFFLVFLTPLRILIEANQESYWIHIALFIQSILITGLTVLFSIHGYGITGLALGSLLGTAPFAAVLLGYTYKYFNDVFNLRSPITSNSELKTRLHQLNRDNLLFELSGKFSLMSDNILIAFFLGADQVVPLMITTKLTQFAQTIIQSVGNASWAGLAQLYASGEKLAFNQKVVQISELIIFGSFAILVPIGAINAEFVRLWVGAENYGGTVVTLISAINAALLALVSFWAWCFTGTGNIRHLTFPWLIWGALNFTCSSILIQYVGIAGPLLGTLISFLAISLWYVPKLMNRIFRISITHLIGATARPLYFGIPFSLLAWKATLIKQNSTMLATELLFMSITYMVLYYRYLFDSAQDYQA